jgi:hypothetical protein
MRILIAALAIYAVYLPVSLWAGSRFTALHRPAGKVIEMITKFEVEGPRYLARTYVFGPPKYPNISQISIYENMTPLPGNNVHFTADGLANVVRIQTSDGSDPRTNGRHYWLVDPDANN